MHFLNYFVVVSLRFPSVFGNDTEYEPCDFLGKIKIIYLMKSIMKYIINYLVYQMRFGDICVAKQLDVKGQNADLKMFMINEIQHQFNVSLTLYLIIFFFQNEYFSESE